MCSCDVPGRESIKGLVTGCWRLRACLVGLLEWFVDDWGCFFTLGESCSYVVYVISNYLSHVTQGSLSFVSASSTGCCTLCSGA